MLIGIGGKAGAGKDTIGDYLVDTMEFQRESMAAPIKRLVKDVFVLDDYTVYDRVAREQPLEEWDGKSVRELTQFIGTELFRGQVEDIIWVKSLWHRIRGSIHENNYVVTDIRFPDELEFFTENLGDKFLFIKVEREGCDGDVGIKGHRSEQYDLTGDVTLCNDGTIKDLYNKVNDVLKTVFTEEELFIKKV
jgi:dephospho-CoA kinase